jgi:hypothetical protein
MSFESGTVSCRMFYLSQPMPKDALQWFNVRLAPPLDALSGGPIHGWVGGRHLLDRKLDETSAYFGGYLRVTLMAAEKKIPESLLRAECRVEELARLQAANAAELDRAARAEIRKQITERLLPSMPPQLKGMTLVHQPKSEALYAEAVSEKQMDALTVNFRETMGFGLIPLTPATAALKRLRLDLRDLPPASFSPEVPDEEAGNSPGQDFLTWLWFFAEARGGIARLPELGEFSVAVEGAPTFFFEGAGAHEIVLRRGLPLLSAEAKTALLSGKKLRRAALVLARGNEAWRVTLNAEEFVLHGLKLPPAEKLDPASRFQERMTALNTFRDALLAFYDRFVKERTDAAAWAKTLKEIHRWVADRVTRK